MSTGDFDSAVATSAPISLRSHIAEQIGLMFSDSVSRLIAVELAEELDEAGYLRADLGEMAERLGADTELLEKVLSACQYLDPTGIFARNLSECLAIQLAARDRLDPAMKALLANLDLLARRDFQSLKKICGVDEEDLLEMIAEIKALDPKPGLAFADSIADIVIPDVVVQKARHTGWLVELNPDALPRVLVDHVYFERVNSKATNRADKDFLAGCLQNANWLTRSLDQRARTILKVSTEIVRQQESFLQHGMRYLRPLKLRTIADAIGMHESTVSRVVTNKYMLTPRGTFELRYFFTSTISSSDGGSGHSSEAVRDQIRRLIVNEKPLKVLSDDAIVNILRQEGIGIARRTVAKYRDVMSIPSSVQRRRENNVVFHAGN